MLINILLFNISNLIKINQFLNYDYKSFYILNNSINLKIKKIHSCGQIKDKDKVNLNWEVNNKDKDKITIKLKT